MAETELTEVVDFLALHAPFDALPHRVRHDLAGRLTVRYHRRGSHLMTVGRDSDELMIIRSGAIETHDAEGRLVFRGAEGSGTQRLYSFRDLLMLKVVKKLLDAGISLQQIRTAIEHLRLRGVHDLSQVTLMSDGVSVYECTTDHEVVDLLRGGQGMFAIALGGVWRDLEGVLLALPTEEESGKPAIDELSRRRQQRLAN